MKTVEELQAVKAKMKGKVIPCEPGDKIRVVVGLATCGIAAGATPVYETIVKEAEIEDDRANGHRFLGAPLRTSICGVRRSARAWAGRSRVAPPG